MASVTASALLDSQAALLEEAAEALPHSFSQCTYRLGYIRQAVYLCQTCGEQRGICSACSIACHTDHEQLELFPKRKFRCDCPTSVLSHPCTLHTTPEDENRQNKYGHNFDGMFCRCGRTYDAKLERETMIQCLSCEDWFHESCLNLRERPLSPGPSRDPTPEAHSSGPHKEEPAEEDDSRSEASSSGLPPPLIGASVYDALVCAACVQKIDTLKQYAGTPGILMVVRDDIQDPWKVIGLPSREDENQDVDIGVKVNVGNNGDGVPAATKSEADDDVAVGNKRPHLDASADIPDAKRHRSSGDDGAGPSPAANGRTKVCLAPRPNPTALRIFSRSDPSTLGFGDVFLSEGWRDRWCKCSDCLPSLQANLFLLEEEDTYEPPDDPDVGISLEELGLRALQRLPRDRAIDSIHAFNEMRDELMSHLRPFAEQGQVVTEADIKGFFEEKMANRRGGR